jgi:hypothetical protein
VRPCRLCKDKGSVDFIGVHVEPIGLGQTVRVIVIWKDELKRCCVRIIWVCPTKKGSDGESYQYHAL